MPLIIDTDIGSDVDDAIALAYALRSGLDVKLITTVHGPVEYRARVAKNLSSDLGYDVSVCSGLHEPITQKQIFLLGIENDLYGMDGRIVPTDGVDTLVRTVLAHDEITIAALGPLTNIATALQRAPEIATHIAQVYMMGNAIIDNGTWYLNYRAFNFKVDPEAVDIIIESDVPKTIITTGVAKQTFLLRNELATLPNNPAFDYIRRAAKAHMDVIGYDRVFCYDPLVIHHCIDDDITEKTQFGDVRVTTGLKKDFKKQLTLALGGEFHV